MKNYIPMIGNFNDLNIELQFLGSNVDAMSFRTTPIEILGHGNDPAILSHATGFFWKYQEKQFLITNRHVVTGRNTFTGEILTKELVQPHRIRYYEVKWHQMGPGSTHWACKRYPVEIDLYSGEIANFYQDPEFDHYKVDIVALPLEKLMENNDKFSPFVNHYKFESLFHYTGMECFVVGYPFRNYAGTMVPIWKSGTLASDPLFPIDNKPIFLVDTLTKDGMSGSPVFRRVFGPCTHSDLTLKIDSVVSTEFVGVYSGRMSSPEFVQAGLGIAWYANRIPKIVSGEHRPLHSSIHVDED